MTKKSKERERTLRIGKNHRKDILSIYIFVRNGLGHFFDQEYPKATNLPTGGLFVSVTLRLYKVSYDVFPLAWEHVDYRDFNHRVGSRILPE